MGKPKKSALEEVSASIGAAIAATAPGGCDIPAETIAAVLTPSAVDPKPGYTPIVGNGDPVALEPKPKPMADHIKPVIMDKAFGLLEFNARVWRATLSETQTISNALDPTFYRHVADKLMGHDTVKPKGRGDIIQLYKPDSAEFAELLVVEIGKGFIKTKLIRAVDPDKADLPAGCPFAIEWNASRQAHDVIRRADRSVMTGGFQSRAGAAKWIIDHMTAMAAA